MKNTLKKFCLTVLLLTLISIVLSLTVIIFTSSGCLKIKSEDNFNEFAIECGATQYYEWCNDLVKSTENKYYCNYDSVIIFNTYSMVLNCSFEAEEFNKSLSLLKNNDRASLLVDECAFNGQTVDVYLVKNEDGTYPDQHAFGFVLVDEVSNIIDFCWFCDVDYDCPVYDENSFIDFFTSYFDWYQLNLFK